MNKRTVFTALLLCVICLAAAFILCLPRGSSHVASNTPVEVNATIGPTAGPTAAPTAEPTLSPTEAPAPGPTAEPTAEPAPEPPVLVNFDHPMFEEPDVEPLFYYISAGNVTFDDRRHADPTAAKALNRMLIAAEREGEFSFIIASAYRSLLEQDIIWNLRASQDPDYGSDPYAEPVVAMPVGCSEHITGLAFDILCEACPHSDVLFASTPEGIWLAENAHRFGFILRYPEDKQNITGVQYEPWHFRYVGVEAAEYIYTHGICLEEYLGVVHE